MNSTLTDPRFWDCECPEKYVNFKEDSSYCEFCDSHEDDQPDSIINEALDFMIQRNQWLRNVISVFNDRS